MTSGEMVDESREFEAVRGEPWACKQGLERGDVDGTQEGSKV